MRMVLFQRTSASCASCARFHTKKIWKFGNTLNFKRTKQTKQNKTANMRLPLSSSWILQCLVNIRRPRPMQGGARQGKRVLLPLFTTATMGSEQKQVYDIWFLFFFFSFLSVSEGTFRCCLAPVFVLSLPCRFAVCQGISFSQRDKS